MKIDLLSVDRGVAECGLNIRNEIKEDFIKNGYTKEVDLASRFIEELLDKSPVYVVTERVTARQVTETEAVYQEQDYYDTLYYHDWVMKDVYAYPGNWIVPSKEEDNPLILSDSKFKEEYSPTEIKGVYLAKHYFKAIENPLKEKIFAQPNLTRGTVRFNDYVWSLKKGEADCWIIDPCDSKGRRSYLVTLEKNFTGIDIANNSPEEK